MDEVAQIFAQYQDHLAPRLVVYEQAIYLYVLGQTIVEGKREATIGFKSARKKFAFGIGRHFPVRRNYLREAANVEAVGLLFFRATSFIHWRLRALWRIRFSGYLISVCRGIRFPMSCVDWLSAFLAFLTANSHNARAFLCCAPCNRASTACPPCIVRVA